jgi:transcriptional regulator with XRE-family HTH domain
MTVGETVRAWRCVRDAEAQDLARAAGISAQHLCDIEHGRRSPSPSVTRALCRVLCVDPLLLLIRSGRLDAEAISVLEEMFFPQPPGEEE